MASSSENYETLLDFNVFQRSRDSRAHRYLRRCIDELAKPNRSG